MTDEPTPDPTPVEQVDTLNVRVIPGQSASATLSATPIPGTTIELTAQEDTQQAGEVTYTYTAGIASNQDHGFIHLAYDGDKSFAFNAGDESDEAPVLVIKTATYMR